MVEVRIGHVDDDPWDLEVLGRYAWSEINPLVELVRQFGAVVNPQHGDLLVGDFVGAQVVYDMTGSYFQISLEER